MRRPSSSYGSSISFGPGPLSPALKALIGANVLVFLLGWISTKVVGSDWTLTLGLHPDAVTSPPFPIWQLATYMFVHASIFHILFNMLALWMFGTELERVWGTPYFLKFYFVTGIGAAALTVVLSHLPFDWSTSLLQSNIVGASGAIYGLLLAYALYFPNRLILVILFPVPAKYAVMIFGAIALLSGNSGVANTTHLGGLLVGYLFLKGARFRPLGEAKYWYLRWKMYRTRKKFGVYSGGRSNDWNRRVH